MFAQTGGGGDNLKHKEEVDNLAVQCRPMNKTEIKNNNTVIVHVDQTKEEIVGIRLIYTKKYVITSYITSTIICSYVHLFTQENFHFLTFGKWMVFISCSISIS